MTQTKLAGVNLPHGEALQRRRAQSDVRGLAADRNLIDRLERGDHDAPEEFVHRFSKLIYAVLYRSGLSYDDIHDSYQAVFLHLWSDGFRRLTLWRGESQLSTYVGAIAARIAVRARSVCSSVRTASPQGMWLDTADAAPENLDSLNLADLRPGPEEHLLQTERMAAVNSVLTRLSARDAELIVRKHQIGESYRAIGEALGMSVGHVGVSLSRAEQRARVVLKREFPEIAVDLLGASTVSFAVPRTVTLESRRRAVK